MVIVVVAIAVVITDDKLDDVSIVVAIAVVVIVTAVLVVMVVVSAASENAVNFVATCSVVGNSAAIDDMSASCLDDGSCIGNSVSVSVLVNKSVTPLVEFSQTSSSSWSTQVS